MPDLSAKALGNVAAFCIPQLITLVLGLIGECESLSMIQVYIAISVLVSCMVHPLKYIFHADQPTEEVPGKYLYLLHTFLGLATIGVAIWGFIITVPHVGSLFNGTLVGCSTQVFSIAFITSSITLICVFGFCLAAVIQSQRSLKASVDENNNEEEVRKVVGSREDV